MQKKIISIIRIFPEFEEQIDFLFQTDENFRDLCSDYSLCAAMVQRLKNKLNKETSDLEEYEELQQHLEDEILQNILKDNDKL